MNPNDIDRFRGWALAALYASMAVLCLMLAFAGFRIWPGIEDGATEVFFLAACGSASAILGARTSFQFIRTLRRGEATPRVALTPFFFMALTLLAASNLFADL